MTRIALLTPDKLKVFEAVGHGMSVKEIVKLYDMNESTPYRYVAKFHLELGDDWRELAADYVKSKKILPTWLKRHRAGLDSAIQQIEADSMDLKIQLGGGNKLFPIRRGQMYSRRLATI